MNGLLFFSKTEISCLLREKRTFRRVFKKRDRRKITSNSGGPPGEEGARTASIAVHRRWSSDTKNKKRRRRKKRMLTPLHGKFLVQRRGEEDDESVGEEKTEFYLA